MRFGERLRSLREDNDEKQKDIAKLLFVSANMISSYELGKHFPKNEKSLITLAEHFDVSLDYLLGYSDIPKHENIKVIDVTGLNTEDIIAVATIVNSLKKNKNIQFIENNN